MSEIYCWTWCGDKHCLYDQRCQRVDKANERLHRSPQQPVVPQRRIGDAEQSGVVVQGDKESTDRKAVDVPQSAIKFECPCCQRQLLWMWTVAGKEENIDRFKCAACSIKVVVSHSFDDLALAAVAARKALQVE